MGRIHPDPKEDMSSSVRLKSSTSALGPFKAMPANASRTCRRLRRSGLLACREGGNPRSVIHQIEWTNRQALRLVFMRTPA